MKKASLGTGFVMGLIFISALAACTSRTSEDAKGRERKLTAGDYSVSISANGAVLAVEKKGAALGEKRTAVEWRRGSGNAGEILLGDRSFPLAAPAAIEERPGGLSFIYDLPTTPKLRVELIYRLTQNDGSACLARDVTLTAAASPSLARFDSDLTVRLPLAPVRLTADTWLPLKNGSGQTLSVSANRQAAYRFAGTLRSSGIPLAIPMVSFAFAAPSAPPGAAPSSEPHSNSSASGSSSSSGAPPASPASSSTPTRITVITDPYFSTLFSEDAVEWTYPKAVGLENGRETRTLSNVFHSGTPDDALAAFYGHALPDVPPGPAWLHEIAMVDYDYMSDGGRGWFRDIDALASAIPFADRSKVLLCLHGWYDFVGRYSFDRATKILDRSWTAFSNYPNVQKDFPNSTPVPLTIERLHERLAYARSRGFRVALYFADGMNAGEGLADIYAPERVLYRGGWRGPDTKGRTYCQNPLRPEVYSFYLDYAKALLREYGDGLDALVWDETFLVPDGSLGTDACPGYADRANMRLVKDITAEVRAFSRRSGRELAFMASDCIGVFNWVTKAPYALVSDGTYQDTHCAPEAWPYGIFPNLRNVLWSCNWEPVTHFDYTEFGVRAHQTPVAISNGWGDDIGFAEMSASMKRRVLDLFEMRKRFPARLRWFGTLPVYAGKPNLRSVADQNAPQISSLSWDTEGGDKVDVNLLRAGSGVRIQFLADGAGGGEARGGGDSAGGGVARGAGGSEGGGGGVWKDAKMTSRRVESGGDAVVYGIEAGKTRLEWRVERAGGTDMDSAVGEETNRDEKLERTAERTKGTAEEILGSLKLTISSLDGEAAASKAPAGLVPAAPAAAVKPIRAGGLSLRLLFPFDPKVTSTTVLPSDWLDDGTFRLPAVLNAPDWGPMLLTEKFSRDGGEQSNSSVSGILNRARPVNPLAEGSERVNSSGPLAGAVAVGRLEGSRSAKVVDLTLELPAISPGAPFTITLTPLVLPSPLGLRDTSLWLAARRGWLNALQPCARWGEQDKPFSAPAGILGNNVISDPASVSIWFYADQAFFTPEPAPGISLMPLVRRTIDYWLDKRMRRDAAGRLTGEITGYWDYGNFLDANASPLVAAWDYVESTGDRDWLERRIERLELVADFLARRDIDGDGLVEATQSGDRGTLVQPNRSDAWWDALNCGHKDGYTNALIYRGWRSLADLERKLGRAEKTAEYERLADRLKAAYSKTLYNPKTGWLAWWKSRDGELHDYAAPTLNGLAIEYGLVEPGLARQILDRLWKKMAEAGFTRFDLGVPPMLVPVRRSDYLQPDAIGIPKREDGTDTFGWYMNGGITAGHVLHFLMAHYVLGDAVLVERADRVLRAMLERQKRGEFQNGVRDAGGEGIDWTSWEGKPTGYEGYLADSFRFLQAVLLREPEFREKLYRPMHARADEQRQAEKIAPDAQIQADIADLQRAANKLLDGCIIKASDGTPLYTPDGQAHYAALWTRDFASMVEYAGYLMSLKNIEKCIDDLIKGVREDGAVPDRVQVDGRPVYTAGAPESPLGEPNIDNAQFLVFAVNAYLAMIPQDQRAPIYRSWSPSLAKGMNYIPLSARGLVWNDPVKPHSPYGFTDTVAKTGELFMESILYWRAAKRLALLEGLFGSGKARDEWEARARAIEKNIGSLWDAKTGMFFAASRDCRQTDIWGNAYAVYNGFPLGEKKEQILDWLASNYDQYIWKGQVRHLPRGEYWERQLLTVDPERYQNGAYWATASGWVIGALDERSPELARRMFRDLIEDFKTGGICECVNVGYRQLPSYVDSATNPLAAARRIWGQ